MKQQSHPFPILTAFLGLLAISFLSQSADVKSTAPISLFNGKDLTNWQITDFAGHGPVSVKEGEIIIGSGLALSGFSWTNWVPRMNYEIELDAKKVDGGDFFCGLTAPFGEDAFTFVIGGWGGGVIGISSIEGMDASENDTTRYRNFAKDHWFHIKVRVTPDHIESWIDQDQVVDANVAGRKVSLRVGDIDLSLPLGVATYQTTAAIKNITLKQIVPARDSRKIVLLAGRKSHGPGDHEYEKSLGLIKSALESSPIGGHVNVELHTNGWPANPSTFEDADSIVVFSDGSDHSLADHPLLAPGRMEVLGKAMKRGAGLALIHYSVFFPTNQAGTLALEWTGGYFDYESGSTPNKWFSKIENREFALYPATTGHPLLNGIKPFSLKDELYFNMKFRRDDARVVPLLRFTATGHGLPETVAWSAERRDGGRGFSFTGGHSFANWSHQGQQRLLLNAILWISHLDVPPDGFAVTK